MRVFLAFVLYLSSCKTLSNRFDETYLRCGDRLGDQDIFLEMVDERSSESLNPDLIDVFEVDAKPQAIRKTSKGV